MNEHDKKMLAMELDRLLEPLSEVGRAVVTMLYGLDDRTTEATVEEVAKELDLSIEQVRLYQRRAMDLLRNPRMNDN